LAIREGAWDCPQCGRTRNRGPRKFCPGCGASRDGATPRAAVEHRFDTPASPPPPVQPAPAKMSDFLRRLGCYGCGCLSLFILLLVIIGVNAPPSYNTGSQDVEYVEVERPPADVPRETVLTVAGVEWRRSIDVEALRTFTESGWEGEVPGGVRALASSREVHHTEQVRIRTETRVRTWTEQVQSGTERVRAGSERVQVGTERVQVGVRDLGNGYFEDVYENRPVYEDRPRYEERPVYREVERRETYQEPVYEDKPVYRQRIRYEIDRWTTVRTMDASGKDLSPAWPEVQLDPGEQEGARRESYAVVLRTADGKTFTYTPATEEEWRGFEVGSTYKATLSPEGELVQLGDVVERAPAPEGLPPR